MLVRVDYGLVVGAGGARQGRWQGCHGSVPDGQAVSSQGVRGGDGGGGDAGLSGSLAGRDTSPVTGGEYGSVREDRAKGMEVVKPCVMR